MSPTTRRRETEITFLRLVPGDTFVHRLWAGTKLIVAAEFALTASASPTWFSLGVLAGLVVLGLLVASIPLGAFPHRSVERSRERRGHIGREIRE